MTSMARIQRRSLILLLALGAGSALVATPAGADEPANGFEVSIQGTGSFSRDGVYDWDDPGSSFSEHGSVSTDGSYSFAGATMLPVYFPTAGTSKQTANFLSDPAKSSFGGEVSAGETLTDSDGGYENSSCSADFVSAPQDIFAFAYRGSAGGGLQLLVAPTVYANRSTPADCIPDAYAVDQLLFPVQASFDGQSHEPDPPREMTDVVNISQSQLAQKSFTVPVSFTGQGNDSWDQEETVPHGYCDFSVPADHSGGCSWNHTWTGTLTFNRVCSAAEGGMVAFPNSVQGRDGLTRWFANGYCQTGGPGGGDDCLVPKVEGKTVKKAKRKLKRANCKLGDVKKASSSKADKGLIVKQKPKPGTRKPAGTKVKVTVGTGPGK